MLLVSAMGGLVSLSPPSCAKCLPHDSRHRFREDTCSHQTGIQQRECGSTSEWESSPEARAPAGAWRGRGERRQRHVVVIDSAGSDECRHLMYALARHCVDNCDASDAGLDVGWAGARDAHDGSQYARSQYGMARDCPSAHAGLDCQLTTSSLVRVVDPGWISRCGQ